MGSIPIGYPKFALLTQLVECPPYKWDVGGSNPSQGTKFALIVKWYNGGFVIRSLQFDSV